MKSDFAYSISTEQLSDFERDGVVLLPKAIDNNSLERLKTATERGLQKSDNYFRRLRVWQDDADFADYCYCSPAPAIVAQLLSTDKVNLFYDQIFVKEPGSAAATPWHNDQPYWPVRGWPVMTLWLALDEVTFDSGALEFIRGSHRWNRWFQPFVAAKDGGVDQVLTKTDAQFEALPDFDAARADYDIACWEMQPGDLLAFHALTVHGARANHDNNRRRRGYAVRYTGREAKYHVGPANNPRLINHTLQHGDALDSEQFPVVFQS